MLITLGLMVASFVTGVVFGDQVKDLIDQLGEKIKELLQKIKDKL
jgi:hypothetical protein